MPAVDTAQDAEAQRIAERLLHESANQGEAIASAVRGTFSVLVLVRFVFEGLGTPGGTARALLELPILTVAIAGSAVAFVLGRRGRIPRRALVASAGVDAVLCFVSLLSTVLWPDAEVTGP